MSEALVLSAGHQLRDRVHALADAAVACEFGRNPRLSVRYGPVGRIKSRQNAVHHFLHLADAIDVNSQALFNDYIGWLKVLLEQRGLRSGDLDHHFVCMAEAVREQMPPPVAAAAVTMIEGALARLPAMPSTAECLLDPAQRLFSLAHEYVQLLLGGCRGAAARLVLDAAERGEPVRELYLQVFQRALREIGRLWQMNEINVAQEHFCSAATEMAMSQLLARAAVAKPCGHSVVVACVSEEQHALGARMIADFFDMAGWDTYFCGASTPHAGVVQTVAKRLPDVLAISAAMGYHVHAVQELIEEIRADSRCAPVTVMVGGHPFGIDPTLWQKVGADGTAVDADGAVTLATQWLVKVGSPP
ncbi:cobalamin B12-binding domain-containing protein [Azohydromonas lata]|uniref:Cobalamin-dependent protein n=1 Tax=Azohydromonas lata TaxID=45677 RepID=A0ABU5I7Z5_9BURK|nr:cobalamin-dependent protein [Azohydromonas lata]MDZ5454959.1 cobalamin-dependent protein [Azohydromonas lata]